MKRVRGIAIPEANLDHAWPTARTPMDPWAGDEALFMRGSYPDYLRQCERVGFTPVMDEAAHDDLDQQFETLYRQVLDGHSEMSALEDVSRALLIWGPARHDRRPLPPAAHPISNAHLADITENQLPQVGQIAPDRILGPWADTEVPRWVRVIAGAVMAFPPEIPPGVPAWARAIKRRPRPDSAERMAIRSIARTPPMLWRVHAGDRVTPHLPLGDRQTPDGAVSGLPDAPAVIGRVVWTGTGWTLACGLPLPALPPAQPLTERLHLELLRVRRRERRLTWEVLLRERSEVLYRTACEWLWLTQERMPWPL